jgi:TonB family protein
MGVAVNDPGMARLWGWTGSVTLHAAPVALAAILGISFRSERPEASVAPGRAVPVQLELHDRASEIEFVTPELPPVTLVPDEPAESFEPDREAPDQEALETRRPVPERPQPAFDRAPRVALVRLCLPPADEAPEVEADAAAVEIHNPPPNYPTPALRRRVEGHALIEVTVLADGTCADPRLVECTGSSLFGDAALETILLWRYRPALENGRPVSVTQRVRFIFRLKA